MKSAPGWSLTEEYKPIQVNTFLVTRTYDRGYTVFVFFINIENVHTLTWICLNQASWLSSRIIAEFYDVKNLPLCKCLATIWDSESHLLLIFYDKYEPINIQFFISIILLKQVYLTFSRFWIVIAPDNTCLTREWLWLGKNWTTKSPLAIMRVLYCSLTSFPAHKRPYGMYIMRYNTESVLKKS